MLTILLFLPFNQQDAVFIQAVLILSPLTRDPSQRILTHLLMDLLPLIQILITNGPMPFRKSTNLLRLNTLPMRISRNRVTLWQTWLSGLLINTHKISFPVTTQNEQGFITPKAKNHQHINQQTLGLASEIFKTTMPMHTPSLLWKTRRLLIHLPNYFLHLPSQRRAVL